MQRFLDGVLGGLVTNHSKCPLDRAATSGLLQEVKVLARHQFGAHLVVDGLGALQSSVWHSASEQNLVRPGQAHVA